MDSVCCFIHDPAACNTDSRCYVQSGLPAPSSPATGPGSIPGYPGMYPGPVMGPPAIGGQPPVGYPGTVPGLPGSVPGYPSPSTGYPASANVPDGSQYGRYPGGIPGLTSPVLEEALETGKPGDEEMEAGKQTGKTGELELESATSAMSLSGVGDWACRGRAPATEPACSFIHDETSCSSDARCFVLAGPAGQPMPGFAPPGSYTGPPPMPGIPGYPGTAGGYPGTAGGYPGVAGGYPGMVGGYPGTAGSYPYVPPGQPTIPGYPSSVLQPYSSGPCTPQLGECRGHAVADDKNCSQHS